MKENCVKQEKLGFLLGKVLKSYSKNYAVE
jgi:hypothetical protein